MWKNDLTIVKRILVARSVPWSILLYCHNNRMIDIYFRSLFYLSGFSCTCSLELSVTDPEIAVNSLPLYTLLHASRCVRVYCALSTSDWLSHAGRAPDARATKLFIAKQRTAIWWLYCVHLVAELYVHWWHQHDGRWRVLLGRPWNWCRLGGWFKVCIIYVCIVCIYSLVKRIMITENHTVVCFRWPTVARCTVRVVHKCRHA